MTRINAVIFDKDGTLYDFNATWGLFALSLLKEETKGDQSLMTVLANALGYNINNHRFCKNSIAIAGTLDDIAEASLPFLEETDKSALLARIADKKMNCPQVPVVPLPELLGYLQNTGLKLGVATNDAEDIAHTHLSTSGISRFFDVITGYDSGFGTKPNPGQLLAFCTKSGVSPRNTIMVGDTLQDLKAAKAAGMRAVGVLTGPASHDELAPHAEIVLDSIKSLPRWIEHVNKAYEYKGLLRSV